jgi:cobalt-zinc-cadmium efflux system outer membrane protein
MRSLFTRAVLAGVVTTSSACASSRPATLDDLDRSLVAAPPRRSAPDPDPAALERAVAGAATLDAITALALVRNPELLVERARVEELLERVPAAARRPDPELKYEQWGVPLVRPYALGEADTIMVGVRQAFPAPGSLPAQERGAAFAAEAALYTLRGRQLDVVLQVERAYLEHAQVVREIAIHREHARLAHDLIELTRSSAVSGGATQQDVLRVAVDLQSLHRDIARLEQRERSAIALLNALMGRAPASPLAPIAPAAAAEVTQSVDELQALAAHRRPELRAAERAVAREQASADQARAAATWPSVMVGLDYMYMPMMHEQHAYGAMVSINLPWLSSGRRAEVRAAERAVETGRRGAEAAAVAVRYEIEDAYARYQAARARHAIARGDLVPAALQSYEAAQGGFVRGRGSAVALLDARRVLLEVRIDEAREQFALQAAIADLERAVGGEVSITATAPPTHGGGHE